MARETRLSETTFVQSPRGRRRLPQPHLDHRAASCRSPAIPRWARRWRWRGPAATARRATCRRPARGCSRSGSSWPTTDAAPARRCCRSRPCSATEVDAAKVHGGGRAVPRGRRTRRCRRRWSRPGSPQLIAPVAAAGVAGPRRARPRRARPRCWTSLRARSSSTWRSCDADAGRAHARAAFSPVVAGGEDPATGSAAGPLCCLRGAQRTGARRLEIDQGAEMGRPRREHRWPRSRAIACTRRGGEVVVSSTGPLASLATRCSRAGARPRRRARCPTW